jgi:hypothetical protein
VTLIGAVQVTGKRYGAQTALSLPLRPGSKCVVGNTPRTSSTRTGVAAIDETYGPSKVVRLFWSGLPGESPTIDRPVVGSFKVMSPGTTAWARTMWRWAYQHEIDSKIAKKQATLAQWRFDMGLLALLGVSGLSVILTADAFVNPTKRPADFLVAGVTHLGVDFDGISSSAGYHDYSRELAAVVAFAKANGLTWGVPEFGANRAGNDPSGNARAAWLTAWTRRFADAGAEYVCLWEFNAQAGSTFTTPAEIAAVRALLAAG